MREESKGNDPRSAESARRILIIHYTAGVGDHLLAHPAIALFKETFPDWQVDVLAHPTTAPIVSYFPEVCQILTLDTTWAWPTQRRRRHLYAAESRPRQFLKFVKGVCLARRRHYQRVCHMISTSNIFSVRKAQALNLLLGFSVNSGLSPLPPTAAYSEVRRAAWCLLGRDAATELKPARIVPRPEAAQWAQEFLHAEGVCAGQDVVGIGVGSANPLRRWPTHQIADLASRLCMNDPFVRIVLLGVSAEHRIYDSIRSKIEGRAISAVGKTNLHELIALVARCRVVVANDSGVMHIAAATSRPLVAIFGSGDRERTMPLVSNTTVVCDSGAFPCKPCYRAECPYEQECMRNITAERVVKAIELATNASSAMVTA